MPGSKSVIRPDGPRSGVYTVCLDRSELGALPIAAELGQPGMRSALNGLLVSEAADADIGHLGLERGHRTPAVTRKKPQGLSCQIG